MTKLHAHIKGISIIGPGLNDWSETQRIFSGQETWQGAPTIIAPPEIVSPRERRRTSPAMRLALNTALAACEHANADPKNTVSVFSSAIGSGSVTERIFTALDTDLKQVSPTDFHNSVHNAAAGYWSIGTQSHTASTSISAGDFGFGVGLIHALMQVALQKHDVLLVCFEHPFSGPLHAARPLGDAMGIGLVLSTSGLGPHITASFDQGDQQLTRPNHLELADKCELNPPARSLALLEHLALKKTGTVYIPHSFDRMLKVEVMP
ncbi:MAG: beta-ketoacyl synthase chain length factor [Magnetovibrio sp.]|nr:beta-ketoacyl synthase chain length factor [Magnetovibrio sp.]